MQGTVVNGDASVPNKYQYQTRVVNTPFKYILPVFTGAKYKCEIRMYEINANDHHGTVHCIRLIGLTLFVIHHLHSVIVLVF